MNKHLPLTAAVLTASLMLGGAGAASAATYTFSQLHSGGEAEANGQLSVDVTEYGSNAVSFTFYNDTGLTAPTAKTSGNSDSTKVSGEYIEADVSIAKAEYSSESDDSYSSKSEYGSDSKGSSSGREGQNSSIAGIYLDGTEGLLVLPGKITGESAGVSFSTGAKPENLPGGKPYDFVATAGADSDAPVYPNGVNAAKEYVTWTFALESGTTYKDVINSLDAGKMRIGLLVPGATGGSASFLNNFGGSNQQASAVPLPASLWLMFGALGGLGFLSRRGRRGDGNSAVSATSSAG